MEQWQIGLYAFVIGLTVNAGTMWGQSDLTSAGRVSPVWIASIEEMSPWCETVTTFNDRYSEPKQHDHEIWTRELSSSGRSILMAEDMHCRQCHGKCEADNLRCRSQCLNDSACLAHCEERSSKCAGMCKQLFQCQ